MIRSVFVIALITSLTAISAMAQAAEGEVQISVDGAPKHYALRTGGDSSTTSATSAEQYTRNVGVLVDVVSTMPYDGFSDSVYPVGGIGLEYRYSSDATVAAQDLNLWFHYGLAIHPVKPVRLDLQIGLAPCLSATELTIPARPSATGNWLLSGGSAEATATLGIRVKPWLGLLARGGVMTTYVSGRNDRDTVTLHASGAIAGAGVILVW